MTSDPATALSAEETAALIEYARQKYAEERWPLSPTLRPVREAIEKLREQRQVYPPAQPLKRHEPSMHLQRAKRRR